MKRNTIMVIVGRKGCGKSTLTCEVVRAARRCLVRDYMHEYGRNVGCEVITDRQQAVRRLLECARDPHGRWKLSLRVSDEDFLVLLGVAWTLRDYLLVIEEAGNLCSPNAIAPEINRIVLQGRHRSISQLYVAQRPAHLHVNIRSQADVVVTFAQDQKHDLRALADTVLGSRAEEARTLAEHAILVGGDVGRSPRAIRARLAAGPNSDLTAGKEGAIG